MWQGSRCNTSTWKEVVLIGWCRPLPVAGTRTLAPPSMATTWWNVNILSWRQPQLVLCCNRMAAWCLLPFSTATRTLERTNTTEQPSSTMVLHVCSITWRPQIHLILRRMGLTTQRRKKRSHLRSSAVSVAVNLWTIPRSRHTTTHITMPNAHSLQWRQPAVKLSPCHTSVVSAGAAWHHRWPWWNICVPTQDLWSTAVQKAVTSQRLLAPMPCKNMLQHYTGMMVAAL